MTRLLGDLERGSVAVGVIALVWGLCWVWGKCSRWRGLAMYARERSRIRSDSIGRFQRENTP
jgi:hypothetical protein